ncbi:MAG TPA: AmmeMemoRadiSam system protein A [Bellilinea sp.]|nr:AmmeMemoRadiSam system protein A [Bellilinea sp.]
MELSLADQKILLKVARETILEAASGMKLKVLDLETFPESLRRTGCSFVTLTKRGALRGCIGALTATMPLVLDVQEHAYAAAMEDYRFPQVKSSEVDQLEIEISVLSPTQPLEYADPAELCSKLRPGVDGVVLRDGNRRSTFLPQVWEQVPDCSQFLSQLCMKMGAPADLWRKKILQVETYTVFEFKE